MLATCSAFLTSAMLIGRDPVRLFAVADTKEDQHFLRSLIDRSGLDADIIETLLQGEHFNLRDLHLDVIVHAACSFPAANDYIEKVALPSDLPIVSISDVPIMGLQDMAHRSHVKRLFKTGLTPELLGSVVLDTRLEHRTQSPQKTASDYWQPDFGPVSVH